MSHAKAHHQPDSPDQTVWSMFEALGRNLYFDERRFAERAFGLFQNHSEYGEVVWRFKPAASAQAHGYIFHPSQTVVDELDGSMTVRFIAAGHLEMAWHLYEWGDAVEVLAPERLREW